MAKLITAKDIEKAASGGTKTVYFDLGSIITPAAKDRARELGVSISVGVNGAAAPRPVAAAAPPPMPTPSQAPAPIQAPPQESGSPTYFGNVLFDNLFNISLELGAAVWVVKERLRTLEELLEQKRVVTNEEIELYRPDPSRERELRAKRDAFIDKIYKTVRENPG